MADPVLVGVDGSEASAHALDWAADEAVARDRELRVLYAVWTLSIEPAFAYGQPPGEHYAAELLTEARSRAQRRAPGVRMSTSTVVDDPTSALLHAGERADLVVVGLRGRGGFPGMRIGSTAYKVAAHSTVPVVVVGTEPRPAAPADEIVVGVDGSRHGRAALATAFTRARARGTRVRAVQAARVPTDPLPAGIPVPLYDPEQIRAEQRQLTESTLAEWRESHPDVEVVTDIQWDDAAHALARASETAELLVVGARGRRGFPRLALGGVAHGVLHYAHCPVMVVHIPPTEREAEPSEEPSLAPR